MQTATNPFPNSSPAYPRDLRSGGPNLAGAGNFYEVTPAAAAQLREYWQQQATAAAEKKGATMSEKPKKTFEEWRAKRNGVATAEPPSTKVDKPSTKVDTAVDDVVPAVSPTKGELLVLDPATLYPAEVILAARDQERADGRRDLISVITDDVLAIWHRWNESGVSMGKIAKKRHNGLIDLHLSQVSKYLKAYREGLAERELAQPPAKTETAVAPVSTKVDVKPPVSTKVDTAPAETAVPDADPEPKPEIEPMQTAVEPFAAEKPENLPTFFDRDYRSQPRPGDALGVLVQLLNDERITVKGSVKLNVEIEFGGS